MDNAEPVVGSEFTASIATKSAIFASGGETLELAIAMLENEDLLADYPFGDCKTGDAANFGIYKMNWYMIKRCPSAMPLIGSNPASSVSTGVGKAINSDAMLATKILLEAMKRWPTDAPDPTKPVSNNFWAGHRWGQSGLDNWPDTNWGDIQRYYLSVQAIKAKCDLEATVWTTDVRYWVDVPAV
jgi:hypothetical protein